MAMMIFFPATGWISLGSEIISAGWAARLIAGEKKRSNGRKRGRLRICLTGSRRAGFFAIKLQDNVELVGDDAGRIKSGAADGFAAPVYEISD